MLVVSVGVKLEPQQNMEINAARGWLFVGARLFSGPEIQALMSVGTEVGKDGVRVAHDVSKCVA
jgi:hypothetical protein